ncbi:hypothetical protein [Candidatus Erwinia haradaeae]|nr:hypothetical protein [Candidatus Erwinia haradaeae]
MISVSALVSLQFYQVDREQDDNIPLKFYGERVSFMQGKPRVASF